MATIRDVAQAANVSAATVSRILNNDTTLSTSQETKERVLQAAKDLNYNKKKLTPLQSDYTIGILQWFSSQQEIEDNYYLLVRQGIEDFCAKSKVNIVRAFKTDFNYMDALACANGVVCIGKFSTYEVTSLTNTFKNIVFLDMPVNNTSIPTITLDFRQAVSEALSYLVSLGHQKIGFLGGQEYLEDGSLFADQRKKVFEQFCIDNNIDYKPYIREDEFRVESGYQMMESLIETGDLPTAVFAASDSIALGAMRSLQNHGYKVPRDISIIGFNNASISNYTNPPLTTIGTPSYAMGMYGASIVQSMIQATLPICPRIYLPCTLTQRESCGEPKK